MEKATPEKIQDAQQYVDFVKNNLEPLAEHLKVSVEWLWQILVQQARVEAIVWLIVTLSMALTTAFLIRTFFKHIKTAKFGDSYSRTTVYKHKKTGETIDYLTADWNNRDKYEPVTVDKSTNRDGYISWVTGVASIFMFITSTITGAGNIETIVTGLVNPEYRAIERIVEFTKPMAEEAKNEQQ